MPQVASRDSTLIAFELAGDGPPVILVLGAFNHRSSGAPLAASLAPRFTVLNYDRRGRGESGDTPHYAVEREIEDLDALIAEAGGSACVFGHSSGATLALQAAARGLAITRLALYEPPIVVDDERPRPPADLAARLAKLVASGQRGEAVEHFQTEGVGIPIEVVAQMRSAPFRPAFEAMAHTLVYEALITGDVSVPSDLAASVTVPTLTLAGGASPAWMRRGVQALAAALPAARHRTLEGQTHDIVPAVVAPVLAEFFAG
jgi:pimeloyl-ACP methyl ester carboxylesterase